MRVGVAGIAAAPLRHTTTRTALHRPARDASHTARHGRRCAVPCVRSLDGCAMRCLLGCASAAVVGMRCDSVRARRMRVWKGDSGHTCDSV